MSINNLFYNKTESLGETNEVICPSCAESVHMRIFRNYDTMNYIAILKQKDTQVGLSVCPKCAAVFTVNSMYIDALLSGQTVFLTQDDLTLAVGSVL